MKINLKTIPYQQLATLIENQHTGTASQLAKQIGVSRSTLFNMLDEIRGAGVEIEYCEEKHSYIYTNNKRIKVNQPIEIIVT